MLPGFRFLLAAIALSFSILVFGLGAAALLRAAHEEFASNQSWRAAPEPTLAQPNEPARAVLALLDVAPQPPVPKPSEVAPANVPASPTAMEQVAWAAPAAPEAVVTPAPETEKAAILVTPDAAPPAPPLKVESQPTEVPAASTPPAVSQDEKVVTREDAAPVVAEAVPEPAKAELAPSEPAKAEVVIPEAAKPEAAKADAAKPEAAKTGIVVAPVILATDPAVTKVASLGGSPAASDEPASTKKDASERAERSERTLERARLRAQAQARAKAKARRRQLAAHRARIARQQASAQQQAATPFGQTTTAATARSPLRAN